MVTMPLEPTETRPRSNFPESRNCSLCSSTTRSYTCQHHAEITQSHTFAALIRLSTTTHNLLTFNISEISSNNSEKLSLLADKHLWTFLLHSSYSSSWMQTHTVGGDHLSLVFTPEKSLGPGQSSPASNSVYINFYTNPYPQNKPKNISKQHSKQAIRQEKLRKITKCLLTRFS